MPPLHPPFSNVKFTLNAWGLAGIFGGEEAILAVALVPLYRGRRWLGWYNTPGSLEVARHFGRLAFSKHPGRIQRFSTETSARLFGLNSKMAPRFIPATSAGVEMPTPTDHLGHSVVERCKAITEDITEIQGRKTSPLDVALIDLDKVDHDHASDIPRLLSKVDILLALFSIVVSVAACVVCAFIHDWYSCSSIAVGILAGGIASMTIGGSVKLVVESPRDPDRDSVSGNGILVPSTWENVVVVIRGSEPRVHSITRGKFGLALADDVFEHSIATSAFLLVLETLAQLVLIPQGTLFGQLLFVVSLCVSWAHNFRVSMPLTEALQADMLFRKLGNPRVRKFLVGTRTTMAVFVAFLTFHGVSNPSPAAVEKILCTFLPNDADVWTRWREKVVQQVCDQSGSHLAQDEDDDEKDFPESEKSFLRVLLGDARAAYDGYLGTQLQ